MSAASCVGRYCCAGAIGKRRSGADEAPPSDEVDAIGISCALAPPAWLPEQLTRLLTKEQGARRP